MTLPKTMSGVVLTGHGGPEVLSWRDNLPVPTPGKGDVVVRVGAAGVNNTDINTRIAWYSKDDASADDHNMCRRCPAHRINPSSAAPERQLLRAVDR